MRIDYISKVSLSSPFQATWKDISNIDHFWFKWRFLVLLSKLENFLGTNLALRALDIGGSQGILAQQIENTTNWTVDIADIDIDALHKVKNAKGKILFYDISDEDPIFLKSYDIVFLFDVIEHLGKTQCFISSALKHLKSGGMICINVPALQCLYSKYDRAVGHLRRYDKKTLIGEFENSDVEILGIYYWGLLLVPFLLIRKLMCFFRKSNHDIVNFGFSQSNAFLLYFINIFFKLESKFRCAFPVGSSLLLIAKKV